MRVVISSVSSYALAPPPVLVLTIVLSIQPFQQRYPFHILTLTTMHQSTLPTKAIPTSHTLVVLIQDNPCITRLTPTLYDSRCLLLPQESPRPLVPLLRQGPLIRCQVICRPLLPALFPKPLLILLAHESPDVIQTVSLDGNLVLWRTRWHEVRVRLPGVLPKVYLPVEHHSVPIKSF